MSGDARISLSLGWLCISLTLSGCKKSTENPSDGIDHLTQGKAFLLQGDLDSALGHFNQAISTHPDDAQGYAERAGIYERKGDYARAIEDYSLAIDKKGDDPDLYLKRALAHEHN